MSDPIVAWMSASHESGRSLVVGTFGLRAAGTVFLGEDLVHTRDYSDETARIIDEEVARILSEHRTRARSELQASMRVLHALADEPLVRETLGADDIGRILDGPNAISVAG